MNYKEIKPYTYIWDYTKLFNILKSKDISLNQLQNEVDISKEDIIKILNSQILGACIFKIAEYLGVDYMTLNDIYGKYDFTTDKTIGSWCDELLSNGYSIEYREYENKQYEFIMKKLGEYSTKIWSSSFTIAIGELHDRFIYYKNNGRYPIEFE